MMLERILHRIIGEGIAALAADEALLAEFFHEEAGLSEDEAQKVADLFVKKPPNVIIGYARADSRFPLYAIILSSDGTDDQFLADEGSLGDDGEPDFVEVDAISVTVLVYSQNPDYTGYLYYLLKHMVNARIDDLKNAEYFAIRKQGGDLAPDAALAPAGLFLRRLTLTTRRQYLQPRIADNLGRVRAVSGIHVDRDGSPGEDDGGVNTNVTTFFEDEEVEDEEEEDVDEDA